METAKELRVLVLDDMPSDAELMVYELQRAGMNPIARRVETRESFVAALEAFAPDIILLDFKLPHFDGKSAMQIARAAHPEMPIIIVTGTLGDEPAIELMRLGAKDYILKTNLVRLAPAVRRALSEEQGIRNRKRAEQALREAHALLRKVTDTSPVGIVMWNTDGMITFANPEALRLMDRTAEDLLSKPHMAREWGITDFSGRALEDNELPHSIVLQTGAPVHSIKIEISASAGRRKLSINAAPLMGESGVVSGVVASLEDVTHMVEAEELLRRKEEHLRMALAAARMVTWVLELPENRLFHSEEALMTFGFPPGFRIPDLNAFLALIHMEDRERVAASLIGAIEHGAEYSVDFRAVLPDGSLCWVSTKGDVIYDDAGAPRRVLGVAWDITERKQAEIALNKANKALQVLSAVNEQLIQAQDEQTLLDAVCRVVVETGDYRLAWVGMPDPHQKTVRPAACFGADAGFLDHAGIRWDESERGRGPTGTAIRTREVQVVDSVEADARVLPWRDDALKRGFRSCIALPLVSAEKLLGALTIYASAEKAFSPPEIRLLRELAGDLFFGITSLRTRLERDRMALEQQRQQSRLQQSLVDSIQTLASMLEMRDPYTAGHQRRVARLAVAIAREIGMDDDRIEGLRLAASIHDLGKIRTPAEILNKPGALAELEFSLIKMHPQTGHDIIKDIQFPWPIARIVLEHHERLDGSGYPNGLRGDDALLESRILAVADVVEAMISHRPYRPGLGRKAALKEIAANRGRLYDAEVVEACLRLFNEGRFRFDIEPEGVATPAAAA
ncbi:MAG TPA: HD domain-containing phosphohydrolase [Noviherbaspirillum sp.]